MRWAKAKDDLGFGQFTDCSLICLESADVCDIEALGFLPMTRCTDDPMARLHTRPKCQIVVSGLYELRSRRSDPANCHLLIASLCPVIPNDHWSRSSA